MASFKVPCPSCEAPVLIKNPKLIGTKVECPKCKYRFKVEEPPPDAAAVAAADPNAKKVDKADDKKKPKVAGKNKKLVPIVVGAIAVVILAVVGVTVLGGSGKKPKDLFGTKGGGNTGGGGEEPPPEVKPPDPPKPTIPLSDKVTTNLLPGQTVAVYRFNLGQIQQSPIYPTMVDQQIGQMFQESMGFAVDDVETYIHCFAGDGRDPFGVIKLRTPTKAPDVTAKIQLQPKPKAVKGRDLHAIRSAPFLVAVSQALSMRALFGDMYTSVPMAPTAAQANKPYGLCVYDTQHILIGDYALLERFLGELGDTGYPPFKTDLNEVPVVVPPPPAGMPETPVAPAPPPKTPGAPPKGPPAKTPPVVKPPAPGEKGYTSVDAYRTLEFPLKRALDDMEADKTAIPLLVYAEKFDAKHYDPKLLKKEYQLLSATLDPIANRTRYLSANVVAFSAKQLVANLRMAFDSADDARNLAKDQLAPGLTTVADLLKLYLTTPVTFNNYTEPGSVYPGSNPKYPKYPGGYPGGDEEDPDRRPGGFPPPKTPPTLPPGKGTYPGPVNPGKGTYPGPIGPGMGTYPGPISPGTGKEPSKTDPNETVAESRIDLALIDNQLLIALDLSWPEGAFRTAIVPRVLGVTNQIKGKMAVFSSDSSWHAVAAAGPKANAAMKTFPRGTADRAKSDPARLGMEYPPAQRVSLFVDLLPHMGRGQLAGSVNKNLAWHDEKNLAAGGAWVPELLVSEYPQSAWRATPSDLPPHAANHVFGATNYVAISGTGLDSIRYDPNDPVRKKEVGMTGYGWGSKAEEVTDGLANTIYMMRTAPGLQQPWIAGGGATVRGFDETDPMNGFRYTGRDGKQGSYALMGDGSVRFIPANIDPKVLLAMGTRAGGDNALLADVNTTAPRIEAPKPTTDPKTDPKPVTPPTGTTAVDAIPPPRPK